MITTSFSPIWKISLGYASRYFSYRLERVSYPIYIYLRDILKRSSCKYTTWSVKLNCSHKILDETLSLYFINLYTAKSSYSRCYGRFYDHSWFFSYSIYVCSMWNLALLTRRYICRMGFNVVSYLADHVIWLWVNSGSPVALPKHSAMTSSLPHELFLTKGVPHLIPAGLEILRKFVLAWRFKQFEEHLFW